MPVMGLIIAAQAETSAVAAQIRLSEMRKRARVDVNQPEIVSTFRHLGFSVLLLHQLGGGCPDILIGKFGRNSLIEIKDGDRSPSGRKLTDDEEQFHAEWEGEIFIVESMDQAIVLAVKLNKEAGG